ncbi:MAG: thiamine phosphate synthase [Pseudomonadota bacterium]
MADADRPQLYLITPPAPDPVAFPDALASVLDAAEIACLRLSLASDDADHVARMADVTRAIAHARDVPLVIDRHLKLVEPHGLDGVHFPDGARHVRAARKELSADQIVGAGCGNSSHDGMSAGEAGADYVAFSPVTPSLLDTAPPAELDLFAWWSEMIELPVIAEGGLTDEAIQSLAPVTDFLAFGSEIWQSDAPAKEIARINALLS